MWPRDYRAYGRLNPELQADYPESPPMRQYSSANSIEPAVARFSPAED
jgi:hypothetical protein